MTMKWAGCPFGFTLHCLFHNLHFHSFIIRGCSVQTTCFSVHSSSHWHAFTVFIVHSMFVHHPFWFNGKRMGTCDDCYSRTQLIIFMRAKPIILIRLQYEDCDKKALVLSFRPSHYLVLTAKSMKYKVQPAILYLALAQLGEKRQNSIEHR